MYVCVLTDAFMQKSRCVLYETVTCQSLPLEPPYIGQLAMKSDSWDKTWAKLSKTFKENVDVMVTFYLLLLVQVVLEMLIRDQHPFLSLYHYLSFH
jgi:hypothetical protein